MKIILLIFVLCSSFSQICSQTCKSPRGMKKFNLNKYANGNWYTIQVDENFQTPLATHCSVGSAFYYHTEIYIGYNDFAIFGKINAPGMFKWSWSEYEYRGMSLNGTFNVYILDTDFENYAVLHITGFVMKFVSVKWIIIQSRTPSLSEDHMEKVKIALKNCYPANWKIVDHNNC